MIKDSPCWSYIFLLKHKMNLLFLFLLNSLIKKIQMISLLLLYQYQYIFVGLFRICGRKTMRWAPDILYNMQYLCITIVSHMKVGFFKIANNCFHFSIQHSIYLPTRKYAIFTIVKYSIVSTPTLLRKSRCQRLINIFRFPNSTSVLYAMHLKNKIVRIKKQFSP